MHSYMGGVCLDPEVDHSDVTSTVKKFAGHGVLGCALLLLHEIGLGTRSAHAPYLGVLVNSSEVQGLLDQKKYYSAAANIFYRHIFLFKSCIIFY